MSKGDYLYLATYSKVTRRYMADRPDYAAKTRLVWANTEEEAQAKLIKAESVDDPYGVSIDVEDLELTEALV